MNTEETDLNDPIESLTHKIDMLTEINNSYCGLVLALYTKLIDNKILSSKDDKDISKVSKKLVQDISQFKLLCEETQGHC